MIIIKKTDNKIKIKLVILILIIFGIVVFGINFAPWVIEKVKQPAALREYIKSFGQLGFLMYVLLQAIHVLLVVIPGDLFNICGGFIYGIPLGFILSMIGLMLGTVCAFYISRLLGYEFISKIIPKEKIDKIRNHKVELIPSVNKQKKQCIIHALPFFLYISQTNFLRLAFEV